MLRAAVENNARWCDAVCRAHGLATRFGDALWWVRGGAPRFYPDVVTLRPGAAAEEVLALAPGSVKDSFACLELPGYEVLFEARWLVHRSPRAAETELVWSAVSEVGEWAAAAGLEGIILPSLASEPGVRFMAAGEGGAILNATGGVVGVSNVFGDVPWGDVTAVAAAAFPGRPLVGYEHGGALDLAVAAGFTPLQRLRVWAR
jgi:DNA-binding transcriptional regulator YdaS (Cro superfamily)